MADFIQGRVSIVHEVGQAKPTQNDKETKPRMITEEIKVNPKRKGREDKSWRQGMAAVSVRRRLVNMTIALGETSVNRKFDDAIFRENYYGDVKAAQRIQNGKVVFNSISGVVKSGAGAAVTSLALGNPALMGVWAVGVANDVGQRRIEYKRQVDVHNAKRDLDLYISNKRRERVNVDTYNRRR